MTYIFKKAIQ